MIDAQNPSGFDWTAFLARFSGVVLVGNSHEADVGRLKAELAPDTLFIFFNRVYKVLDAPFDGDALLVSGSTPTGALIVRSGVLDLVLPLLVPGRLHGIVDVRVTPEQRRNGEADFGAGPVIPLDLFDPGDGFYTPGYVPTTGFAFLVFLLGLDLPWPVRLHGFTGRPSPDWRMSRAHDWGFEQGVLRYLAAGGRIRWDGYERGEAERIAARFGDASPERATAALLDREIAISRAFDRSADQTTTAGPLAILRQKLVRAVLGKRRSEALTVARRRRG